MAKLQAPFPYFGGKSMVASIVWDALGNPAHYIEPFFGSGAVLLARPNYDSSMCETINDKDGFICNVWRALKYAPDETAEWCDWPVNHADLCARRKVLLANEDRLLENLIKDDMWYDVKLAGYWIWAASCWIGSGLTCPNAIPHLTDKGNGVHKASLIGKIPHLTHKGKGVHRPTVQIHDWFQSLSDRLRRVRVVCGDWTRVCGGNSQDKMGICGMFFDPPYGVTDRCQNIYYHDSITIVSDVQEWVLERGKLPSYRIVVAGYEEYPKLIDNGWRIHHWKASGGYSNQAKNDDENNRHREVLYFSPHCINNQRRLFC